MSVLSQWVCLFGYFNRLLPQCMARELALQEWQPHPVSRSYNLCSASESLQTQVPLPSHHSCLDCQLPVSLFPGQIDPQVAWNVMHACLQLKQLYSRDFICIWWPDQELFRLRNSRPNRKKHKRTKKVDPFIDNENTKIGKIPSHQKYHTVN